MEWKGIEYNGRAGETGLGLFEREREREGENIKKGSEYQRGRERCVKNE